MSKIWIDPGHGGNDPGAVNGTRLEKDDALKFALELERCFLAYGCETVLTRRADTAVAMSARTRLEREQGCALALSCHRNAAGSNARGFELWLHHQPIPEVIQWAAKVARAVEAAGMPLRGGSVAPGVYTGYRTNPALDYAVNRETNAPSMLLELGFVTNAEDNKVFDASLSALCKGIAQASAHFLGLEEKAGEVTPPNYSTLYERERERLGRLREQSQKARAAIEQIVEITADLLKEGKNNTNG